MVLEQIYFFLQRATLTVMTKAKERFTSENNSTLSIDGNQIKQVFHHKLLGLVIDSHLTWNDHVDYIVSKAASRLFLLKKIKPFLSLKERKLFYSSMIMPVLAYGSVIWGDFYVGITERLLKQQKRAARIILDVKKPTDTPSPDLFAKLNWLSFDKCIILQRGTLVYKCLNNLAPDTSVISLPSLKIQDQGLQGRLPTTNWPYNANSAWQLDRNPFFTEELTCGTVFH